VRRHSHIMPTRARVNESDTSSSHACSFLLPCFLSHASSFSFLLSLFSASPLCTTEGSGRSTSFDRSLTSTTSAWTTETVSFPPSGRKKSSRTSTQVGSFARRRMAPSTTPASHRAPRTVVTTLPRRREERMIGSSTSTQSLVATSTTTPIRMSRASIVLLAFSLHASLILRRRRYPRSRATTRWTCERVCVQL